MAQTRFPTLWETDRGTYKGHTGYQVDVWSTCHLITWGLSLSTKPLYYKTLGFLLPWNDQQVIVENNYLGMWKRDSAEADRENDQSCPHLKTNCINIMFSHLISISCIIHFQVADFHLHFNENSDRECAKLQDDTEHVNIAFPKYKKGEHTIRKILVQSTYSKWR